MLLMTFGVLLRREGIEVIAVVGMAGKTMPRLVWMWCLSGRKQRRWKDLDRLRGSEAGGNWRKAGLGLVVDLFALNFSLYGKAASGLHGERSILSSQNADTNLESSIAKVMLLGAPVRHFSVIMQLILENHGTLHNLLAETPRERYRSQNDLVRENKPPEPAKVSQCLFSSSESWLPRFHHLLFDLDICLLIVVLSFLVVGIVV